MIHEILLNFFSHKGRKVHDYGDVQVGQYSSSHPEVIDYRGYRVKNSKVCGDVSRKVKFFNIIFSRLECVNENAPKIFSFTNFILGQVYYKVTV